VSDFTSLYTHLTGTAPSSYATYAFDAMLLVARAIETARANQLDPAVNNNLLATMRTHAVLGLTGTISYRTLSNDRMKQGARAWVVSQVLGSALSTVAVADDFSRMNITTNSGMVWFPGNRSVVPPSCPIGSVSRFYIANGSALPVIVCTPCPAGYVMRCQCVMVVDSCWFALLDRCNIVVLVAGVGLV
jgi:hypothetical protein